MVTGVRQVMHERNNNMVRTKHSCALHGNLAVNLATSPEVYSVELHSAWGQTAFDEQAMSYLFEYVNLPWNPINPFAAGDPSPTVRIPTFRRLGHCGLPVHFDKLCRLARVGLYAALECAPQNVPIFGG
jgi:hypothetical protein